MTMIPNPKRAALVKMIERARQHQEMHANYPAYQEILDYITGQMNTLNDTWHLKAVDDVALQQLRGQKQLLTQIEGYFNGELKASVDGMTEVMMKMPEHIDNTNPYDMEDMT